VQYKKVLQNCLLSSIKIGEREVERKGKGEVNKVGEKARERGRERVNKVG
jgi:hypothetical protein